MKILVACEFSGVVRDAFIKKGHDVLSCDILPTDSPGPHYQGDILDIINLGWDMMIAHPPCTYLTRAGARWWSNRVQEQKEAIHFVKQLLAAPIPQIALENPPGAIGTQIRKADQYIQPWQFGHTETKMTGFWLKDIPKLQPTVNVYDEMMLLPKKLRNKIHYIGPDPNRSKLRSITYSGIADAMAEQWGALL